MKIIVIAETTVLAILFILGIYGYVRYWNIATVNGTPISRLDYIKAMESQGGKQTLDSMINTTLVLNEGEAKGVKTDQKAIDGEIAKIETQLKSQNETLDSALKANGMVMADLVNQIKIKLIETALATPKTTITQEQIDAFLTANKAMLPAGKTNEELQALAKDQLLTEAEKTAATDWLTNLRKSAKIIYR